MKTHNIKEGGVVWFCSSLAAQLTFRALHSPRGLPLRLNRQTRPCSEASSEKQPCESRLEGI